MRPRLFAAFLLPSRLLERAERIVRDFLARLGGPGGGRLARVPVPVRSRRNR